jgi:L-arabinose transport system ATP-binding protein
MAEIRRIADKVAIFKDGRYVATVRTADVTDEELVRMMVGRDLGDIFSSLDRNKQIGDVFSK